MSADQLSAVELERHATAWLAAIPLQFHVHGGPEFHAAVVELGRRMNAATEPPGSGRSGPRDRPAGPAGRVCTRCAQDPPIRDTTGAHSADGTD